MIKIISVHINLSSYEPNNADQLQKVDQHLAQGWKLLSVTTGLSQRTGDWFDSVHFYHLHKTV